MDPLIRSAGIWLHCAGAGLFLLAAAAAAVSFTAQYRLVFAARGLALAAGLEAAIPDAAALVFACLGVALALHGRRAVRARLLNAASAGTSVFMNSIAAGPGWQDTAVWVMPPVAYALASDTLIGVIRTRVTASQLGKAGGSGAEDVSMLGWPAGWCCGCCACAWRRRPRWPGSGRGCCRSARSPLAATLPARLRPPSSVRRCGRLLSRCGGAPRGTGPRRPGS
jgi:hypothetical protein